MKKSPRFFLKLITTLTLAGCANTGLPDYVKLGDLRILALIPDAPEVNVGTTVTITPLLSDINGKGRSLTYSAAACNDPGIGYGAVPTCENSTSKVVLASGAAAAGLASPNYTGTVSTFTVTVPTSVLDNRSTLEKFNGVSYLITYSIVASDGTTVKSFKRIIVSTKAAGQLNQNPQVLAIQKDGATLTSVPSAATRLTASFASGTAETYSELQPDATTSSKTETLSTTWFISDGTVTQFRTIGTDSTEYTPADTNPTSRNVIFALVTRDGRGGEGFRLVTF